MAPRIWDKILHSHKECLHKIIISLVEFEVHYELGAGLGRTYDQALFKIPLPTFVERSKELLLLHANVLLILSIVILD